MWDGTNEGKSKVEERSEEQEQEQEQISALLLAGNASFLSTSYLCK